MNQTGRGRQRQRFPSERPSDCTGGARAADTDPKVKSESRHDSLSALRWSRRQPDQDQGNAGIAAGVNPSGAQECVQRFALGSAGSLEGQRAPVKVL
jgi:hypothetical protein